MTWAHNTPQPGSDERGRAAVVFTGLLTLFAGGAGLAVAGLILGFDYLLRGEPDEREALTRRRAENRRARYDDALAWLEADRKDQARARAAKRAWFEADRDTRSEAPSSGETFGRILARTRNRMIVGGHRFRRGWQDGRTAARRHRTNGDRQWWLPERTARPATSPTGEPIEPVAETEPQQPPTDEIVDAEIVPEPETPAARPVVPVGADTTPLADDRLGDYGSQIDSLRTEVARNNGNRNDDPSPPLSALR